MLKMNEKLTDEVRPRERKQQKERQKDLYCYRCRACVRKGGACQQEPPAGCGRGCGPESCSKGPLHRVAVHHLQLARRVGAHGLADTARAAHVPEARSRAHELPRHTADEGTGPCPPPC
jgi:hypothetical protein